MKQTFNDFLFKMNLCEESLIINLTQDFPVLDSEEMLIRWVPAREGGTFLNVAVANKLTVGSESLGTHWASPFPESLLPYSLPNTHKALSYKDSFSQK